MTRRQGQWVGVLLLAMLLGAGLWLWQQGRMRNTGQPAAKTAPAMQRVVVLNSDALEVLHLLQADDRVVGVYSDITQETALWPEMAQRPQVGKWSEPNIEAIAQLAPDIVIHYKSSAPYLEEKLNPLGIDVLRLDLFRIDTLQAEVAQLGDRLGRSEQAQRFNAWHQQTVAVVSEHAATAPHKARAYLENYADYSASGTGSGLHTLCEKAHCHNVAAALNNVYPRVTPEWVLAQNPDVVIKLSGKVQGYALTDAGAFNQLRDRMAQRPAWLHMAAVQQGRLHVMDAALTSGPRVAVALAYIAQWMYPEQTAGIDPDVLHRQYFEQFLRKPFQGRYFSDAAPTQQGKSR